MAPQVLIFGHRGYIASNIRNWLEHESINFYSVYYDRDSSQWCLFSLYSLRYFDTLTSLLTHCCSITHCIFTSGPSSNSTSLPNLCDFWLTALKAVTTFDFTSSVKLFYLSTIHLTFNPVDSNDYLYYKHHCELVLSSNNCSTENYSIRLPNIYGSSFSLSGSSLSLFTHNLISKFKLTKHFHLTHPFRYRYFLPIDSFLHFLLSDLIIYSSVSLSSVTHIVSDCPFTNHSFASSIFNYLSNKYSLSSSLSYPCSTLEDPPSSTEQLLSIGSPISYDLLNSLYLSF